MDAANEELKRRKASVEETRVLNGCKASVEKAGGDEMGVEMKGRFGDDGITESCGRLPNRATAK